MKCAVTLNNGIDGIISSSGELALFGAGFDLFYDLDGDECLFSFDGKVLTQTRKGSLDLKLVFENGKETLCSLGSGELTGTFPVFTNLLRIIKYGDGIEAELGYVLGGESKRLTVKAEIIR